MTALLGLAFALNGVLCTHPAALEFGPSVAGQFTPFYQVSPTARACVSMNFKLRQYTQQSAQQERAKDRREKTRAGLDADQNPLQLCRDLSLSVIQPGHLIELPGTPPPAAA